jgi:hypothetical protein
VGPNVCVLLSVYACEFVCGSCLRSRGHGCLAACVRVRRVRGDSAAACGYVCVVGRAWLTLDCFSLWSVPEVQQVLHGSSISAVALLPDDPARDVCRKLQLYRDLESKAQQHLIQQRLEFWQHAYKVHIHSKVNGQVKTGSAGSGCLCQQDAVKAFKEQEQLKGLAEVIPLWLDGVAYLESTPRHLVKPSSSNIPLTWGAALHGHLPVLTSFLLDEQATPLRLFSREHKLLQLHKSGCIYSGSVRARSLTLWVQKVKILIRLRCLMDGQLRDLSRLSHQWEFQEGPARLCQLHNTLSEVRRSCAPTGAWQFVTDN